MISRGRAVVLLAGFLVLAVVPAVAAMLNEPFYLDLFRRIMIFAIAAVSLDLILGYGGMVSFGHAAYLRIGAYAVAVPAFYGIESGLAQWTLAAFVLAGAVCGLAGALLTNQTDYLTPSYMHWTRSGEIMVMVILGGMGTLVGPVLGAAAYLLLEDVLSAWTVHWQIVLGPLLVLVVLYARRGLYGLLPGSASRDG